MVSIRLRMIRHICATLCLAALLIPALPVAAIPPADLQLNFVVSGLSSPVAARHAGDGSGRLFIVEQAGRIRIYDGGALLATPFLNISGQVLSGGELGLLGLAFHPNYDTNGFFYVNYTRNPPGPVDEETVVSRFTVSAGDANVANAGSELEIITITQDFGNHNGGNILFGPDGYLYIGMGDGGGGGDPFNRAQDLNSLLGKMLRIDVDGGSPYAIPGDNPFSDEIWAYGLRNPWRWSFDRYTGDLYIGDVGQDNWEEIDYQPSTSTGGENYGWDCREGAHNFPGGSNCPGAVVEPILEYAQGPGCSIVGGYLYRGPVAGLGSTYIYSDTCSGQVWFGTRNAATGNWSSTVWDDTTFGPFSFGEDEAGNVYMVNGSGSIYRFESVSSIFGGQFEPGNTSEWSATVGP